MSKNLFRKGLALSTVIALGLSALTGTSANAQGTVDGFVSLSPNTGTAYSVLANGTFDYKSSYDASITLANRFHRFLVTDPDRRVVVDGRQGASVTDYADARAISAATNVVATKIITITSAGHNFQTGDIVTIGGTTFSGDDGGTPVNLMGDYSATRVDADTFRITHTNAAIDGTGVTLSAATATFKSSGVTAATGVVKTGDDEIVLTVDNASPYLVGDTVTVAGTTFTSNGVDKKDTGYTITAVNDSTNTVTITKASLGVTAGALVVSAIELVVTTFVADTGLTAQDSLVGKALGNWRVLGQGANAFTVSARNADGSFVVTAKANDVNDNAILRLAITGETSYSPSVIAWVDNNGNSEIDSTEKASPSRVVNFYANAQLSATTTITPVIGSTAITGTVAITPELNGQQVGNSAVGGQWTVQSPLTIGTLTSTYNTVTKVWDVGGTLSAVATQGNYSVVALVNGLVVGTAANSALAAPIATDTLLTMAASADQQQARSVTAVGAAENRLVRSGKAASVVVTAYDATGAALPAGRQVTVRYTAATTGTVWTVNGVAVLAAGHAGLVNRTYTTDAKGQVTLAVSSTAGANNDTITIEATPENIASGVAAGAQVQLTWATASYTLADLNNPGATTARTTTKGGGVTFDFFVGDQWNAGLTGDYRLYVASTGRTSFGANVALAAGRGSVTIPDNQLGSGLTTISVTADLQRLVSGTWATSTSPVVSQFTATITPADNPGSQLLPALTYSSGTPAVLSVDPITEWNSETTQGNFVDPSGARTAEIALTAFTAGDLVTVSGSDLFFGYSDGGTITRVSKNQASFYVGNTADKILVFANVYAKDKVITLSSRGRTATVKVTFDVANPELGEVLSISAPKSIKAGRTLAMTVRVTDQFGNPVNAGGANSKISFSYDGPGLVVTDLDALATAADANSTAGIGVDGLYTVRVLLGSSDTGPAVLTFNYDGDGTVATTLDNFSVSSATWVGPIANAKAGAKDGRVIVEAYRAKGKTVNVFVGSTRVASFVADKANDSMVVRGIKSGTRNVRVTLSGPGEDFRGVITVK